ncbi:MAG: hypothetical protein HRF50_11270 [Phycisphaerae bacterium]|jgi:uncharacterized membrane protein
MGSNAAARSQLRSVVVHLAAVSLAATASAQAPTFTGLTDPFPGGYVDGVRAVNADGSVVVGYTYKPTFPDFGNRSFRWRRGIGFDDPGPTQGVTLSYAAGVSADGNVISGNTGHAQFGDQEAWVRVGESRGHVGSPPGYDFSSLAGVSANGVICAGWGGDQTNPNSAEAASYDTSDDSWMNLGFLSGGSWSKALAASADGSVIVGVATDANPMIYSRAIVWTTATGMQPVGGIGNLPDGIEAEAVGVSADGSVIVGTDYVVDANYNSTLTAWRWTAATGMVPLATNFYVGGVSPDGQLIAGTDQSSGDNEPAIWDAAHGVRNLRSVLQAQGLGAQIADWYMCCATAVNQSGSTYVIAGEGGDPAGYIAGWVVTLPSLDAPDCPGDLNGDLVVDLADLSALLTNFGAGGGMTLADGDLDGDGDVDLADLSALLERFGATC